MKILSVRFFSSMVAAALLLSACSGPATSPSLTITPVETDLPPTVTVAPTPTLIPESTPTVSVPSSGPWLVALTRGDNQLVAVSMDGSSEVKIRLPDGLPVWSARDLTLGAAPHGGWLAVRTGNRNYTNLKLNLVHLPDGAVKELTLLLSAENEARVQAADPSSLPGAVLAVTQSDTLSWSPDGRYLAYIAAVDGRSSDLYVYDSQKDDIRRVTQGSYDAAQPLWSPDGKFIIFQQVLRFTTNSQWVTHSVWAMSIDRPTDLRRLYVPSADSIGEVVLGWSSPDVMMVSTRTLLGQRRAREVSIERRRETVLVPGAFDEIAFDPASQSFAFTINEPMATSTEMAPGLYLLKPYHAASLAQMGNWSNLVWSAGAGRFIANGLQGVISVTPAGNLTLIKNESQAVVSPNGEWLATCSAGEHAGLRLYPISGKLLQDVSSQAVDELVWMVNSNGVYYRAGSNLYRASFPQAAEQVAAHDVVEGADGGMSWVP